MLATTRATLARFRRLTPFVSPFFPRLVLVFALSLFGTILGLLWPIFTKILIDDVLLAKNLRLLWILSGVMVVVTAVGYVVGAINRYYYTQVTARILFALREYVFVSPAIIVHGVSHPCQSRRRIVPFEYRHL